VVGSKHPVSVARPANTPAATLDRLLGSRQLAKPVRVFDRYDLAELLAEAKDVWLEPRHRVSLARWSLPLPVALDFV
jgi:hypothetical protein